MAYALEISAWATHALTWSFAQRTYPADAAGSFVDAPFSSFVTQAGEQAVIRSAFARWGSVSGLTFTEVTDQPSAATAADIRVGFAILLGRSEIGEADTPYSLSATGAAVDNPDTLVRLQDPSALAISAVAGTLQYQGTGVSLYQVALHEIGHAIGLDHDTSDRTAVMYPIATPSNPDVSADDIAGVQALYGAPASSGPPSLVTLHGPHTDYTVSPRQDGSIWVQDAHAGRDGTLTMASGTTLAFTDGHAVVDVSGVAEDVDRLYQAAFNRPADLAGVDFWTTAVKAGQASLASVADAFTRTPEFAAHDGVADPAGYVQILYQNILGRTGDAAGLSFWTRDLQSGLTRGQVLAGIAASAENLAKTLPVDGDMNAAEATRLYQAAFNRMGDAGGLSFWTSALASGATPQSVADGFVASPEFAAKFAGATAGGYVEALYDNILHRAAEASGAQFWQDQISGGATRAQVLVGFADSNENRVGTAGLTHDGWAFLS